VAAGSYADHEPAALDEPAVAYDDEPLGDGEYEDDDVAAVRADDRDRDLAPPPQDDLHAHQPTREFSATELDEALGQHEAPPAEPPARREHVDADDADNADDDEATADELDQTPDFLQETPEHDRLWFEQKPPKDFDF
jgi:hypothetical protein